MSRCRTNNFDFEFAMKLYNEGKSWQEMGRILEIHPYSVQYWFAKRGLLSKRSSGQKRSWDTKDGYEMKQKGLTYREIAQTFGVSITAVYAGIKSYESSISKGSVSSNSDGDSGGIEVSGGNTE